MTTIRSAQVSLPTPTEHSIDVRGRRVRLAKAGAGAPVVYLHGSGDLGGWGRALSLLARDFTVYRPDHPGFNLSDEDPSVDSVLDMAFSYLDLFDSLGLDRPSLIGVSFGGWLAAQIAVLAPARIAKVVLVDAAGLRADIPTPDIFTLSPVQHAELLYHRPVLRNPAIAVAEKIQDDAGLFQRYLRNRMATAHLAWNPYFHDPKLPGRLHRLTAPVLVVWGAQDRLLPVGYAHRWMEALGPADGPVDGPADGPVGSGARLDSPARLEIIDNAGHLPAAEQPDTFAALVREFLSEEKPA
jgi:pimeloyl-ACP methyl ester carboxylesterase